MNIFKEEIIFEELMECFDDLFELIEICLEVIVLEKVYKEVLEIFNKV